jgi:hypothetical protein
MSILDRSKRRLGKTEDRDAHITQPGIIYRTNSKGNSDGSVSLNNIHTQ